MNLLVAALLLLLPALVSATCKEDLQNADGGGLSRPISIDLLENTPDGTILLNVSSGGSLSMQESFPFLDVIDGKLVTTTNITVDGSENTELCTSLRSLVFLTLKCKDEPGASNVQRLVFITTRFTDDFNTTLDLEPVSVSEQVSGLDVIDLESPMRAADADCGTTINMEAQQTPDMEEYFEIQGGSRIVLKKALDFEKRRQYTMDVSATSQLDGSPLTRVVGELTINVQDVDDRDPEFDQQIYTLTVAENNEATPVWLDATPPIRAQDGDQGVNTTLVYSLQDSLPIALEIFASGQIRINSTLDRESQDTFTVILKAAQTDNPLASATATLSISVSDTNDNRPDFSPTQVKVASVQEGAAAGSHVVWLVATDADQGKNAEFDFQIQNDTGAFEVRIDDDTKKAQLVVKDAKLLPEGEEISVEIRLVEKEQPSGGDNCDFLTSCVATIAVTVIDTNNHAPEFTHESAYKVSIHSDQEARVAIRKIEATDADKGSNADIAYTLTLASGDVGECNKLTINSSSGEISLLQAILPGKCFYTVSACDNPTELVESRRCSQQIVELTALQAVDASGNLTVVNVTVHILEGLPIGSLVYEMPLENLVIDNENFTLTGKLLKTASVLDREDQSTHVVQAFLGSNSPVAVEVRVEVDDVNDNAPMFTSDDYIINVDQDSQIGDVVLAISAIDLDAGDESLDYSLLNLQ